MVDSTTLVPETRCYKTVMRKQSKWSISGKRQWAAMSAEQKQVILHQLKKHREMRKKHVQFSFSAIYTTNNTMPFQV